MQSSSAAVSAWIESNLGMKHRKRARKTANKPAGSTAPQSTAPTKRSRKRKAGADIAPLTPAQPNPVAGTPLRIPYGNKDVAMSSAPAMARRDGMPRLALIFLHLASVDGCDGPTVNSDLKTASKR